MAKLSYRKAIERAKAAHEKNVAAIYATAPDNTTPFFTCHTNAPLALKDAYHETLAAVIAAEQAAIDAGRAYRGTFSMLVWSR